MKAFSSTQATESFLQDVLDGLSAPQRTLPCKYLYDQRGSELFEKICETDEYYPTRTELSIMEENAPLIAKQIGKGVMLVELGSGSSLKTRILLDALEDPSVYVPVDISESHLMQTADSLRSRYSDLEIAPVVADFTQEFELPQSSSECSHVALYFPGSTIGNFTSSEAGELLRGISSMLGPQGGLLIGIDLQKDPEVIELAYNDNSGVTAEFNLNLLNRINNELGADFDLEAFEHCAVYNSEEHRVEISLRSLAQQQVSLNDQIFKFQKGEEILTEYSHKYTVEGFSNFAAEYGFSLHQQWTDPEQYFAVLHLVIEN
jgi:dimethylhistidine N-methyltransferase